MWDWFVLWQSAAQQPEGLLGEKQLPLCCSVLTSWSCCDWSCHSLWMVKNGTFQTRTVSSKAAGTLGLWTEKMDDSLTLSHTRWSCMLQTNLKCITENLLFILIITTLLCFNFVAKFLSSISAFLYNSISGWFIKIKKSKEICWVTGHVCGMIPYYKQSR